MEHSYAKEGVGKKETNQHVFSSSNNPIYHSPGGDLCDFFLK